MYTGGIPSDGIKGSSRESKTWGRGPEGRKRPLVSYLPSVMLGPPHSGQLVMHFLSLSLLLHTLNKHWSAHIQARGPKHCPLLSWGPGPVSVSGPNLSTSWLEINYVRPQKVCSSASLVCEKRLAVGNFQPTRSPMKLFYCHKHNAILSMIGVCFWFWCTVCTQHSQTGQMLTKRREGKKTGSKASNYTDLIGGCVQGLGQGRTGNTRPRSVGTATWCRCTADHLHKGKHTDEIKADTH